MLMNEIRRLLFFVLVVGCFVVMALMFYEPELSPGVFRTISSNVTRTSRHTALVETVLLRAYASRRKQNISNPETRDILTNECSAKFEPTFEANLNHIRAYNLSASFPYMEKLKLETHPPPTTSQSNVTVPVFVTACSSNHFKENMGLLENIEKVARPVFKDLKIVLFDLGLNTVQIEKLSDACRCKVRKFPLSDTPAYFKNIKGCPWKPIVLQMVLKEYPFVMWLDSSVRFTTGNLQPMFKKALSSGIVLNFRKKPKRSPSIRLQTHQDTFNFLNEPPCLYEKELMIEAGLIALYPDKTIYEGILNPWTKCALIEECIWTTRPMKEILKCWRNETLQTHRCHRYDQSVLNILMKRLFHKEIDRYLVKECDYAYFRNSRRCKRHGSALHQKNMSVQYIPP